MHPINLAHQLDMQAIAEGVETSAQCAQLKALNCERAQGNFLAEPLSPQAAEVYYTQDTLASLHQLDR